MAGRVSPAPLLPWTPDQVRGDGEEVPDHGGAVRGDGRGVPGDGGELERGAAGGSVKNISTVELKAEAAKIIRGTV